MALYDLLGYGATLAKVVGFARAGGGAVALVQDGDHSFPLNMNHIRVDDGLCYCGLEVSLLLSDERRMNCILQGINGYYNDVPIKGLLCADISSGAIVAVDERLIVSGTVVAGER